MATSRKLTVLTAFVTKLIIKLMMPIAIKIPPTNCNTDNSSKLFITGTDPIIKISPNTMKTAPAVNKLKSSCLSLRPK